MADTEPSPALVALSESLGALPDASVECTSIVQVMGFAEKVQTVIVSSSSVFTSSFVLKLSQLSYHQIDDLDFDEVAFQRRLVPYCQVVKDWVQRSPELGALDCTKTILTFYERKSYPFFVSFHVLNHP